MRRIAEMQAHIDTMKAGNQGQQNQGQQNQGQQQQGQQNGGFQVPVFNDLDYNLTATEREAYEAAIPVIKKVAVAHLADAFKDIDQRIDAAVSPKIAELQAKIDVLSGDLTGIRTDTEAQFNAAMETVAGRNGVNLRSLPNNPAWQQFITTPIVQGAALTNGQDVAAAMERRDSAQFELILKRFIAEYYPQQGQQAQLPQEQPQMTPGTQWTNQESQWVADAANGSGAARAAMPEQASTQMIKASTYDQFVAELNKGLHSVDEFNTFDAAFTKAIAEGRVDLNS